MTPMFDWGAPIEEGRQAVSETTTALEGLGATVTETAPAIDGLTDAIDTSSKSTGGFGAKLLALAGGPIGIATTAITSLIAIFVNHRAAVESLNKTLDSNRQKLDDTGASADDMAAATDAAATATRGYADELRSMSGETDTLLGNYAAAEQRVLDLADAQRALKEATIDARVAAGEITKDQGEVEKGDLDIEAATQKADAEVKVAEARKAAADAEVKRAADAEKQAAADAAAADARAQEVATKADRARAAIATKNLQADIVGSGSSADAVAAIGEKEARDRLSELPGIMGGLARGRLSLGEGPETIMGSKERLAIAQQMADEAAAELEALTKSSEESKSAANEIAEERKRELEAVKALREKAEADAAEAGKGVADAKFNQGLVTDYVVPTIETRNDTTRAVAEKRAQDEAAAKAEAAQAAAATEAANTAAREASAQAARMAGNATANGGVPASVVGAVENAAAKLADGTTEQEIAGVMGRIVNALEGVPAAQQSAMRAALDPLISRLEQVESQIRNGTRK
jgi:hypothetical protein